MLRWLCLRECPLRMRRWACAALVLLVCAAPALAATEQARETLVNRRVQLILERIPELGLGLPTALQTDRDVYLVVTAGAAYLEVVGLARPTVPPEGLARTMETGLSAARLPESTVFWSVDRRYAAARVLISRGRFGSRAAAAEWPLGPLIAAWKRAGLRPHVLLRVPLHSGAPKLGVPARRLRTSTWYNATALPPDVIVRTSARLSTGSVVLSVLFALFVPVVTVSALIAGLVVARSQRIPVERRRRLYAKLVQYPPLAAIIVHMPFALVFLRSLTPLAVSDVWFGSPRVSSGFGALLLGGVMAVLILLPVATSAERRLFGPRPEEAAAPEATAEERAAEKTLLWAQLAPLAIAMFLIAGRRLVVPRESPWSGVLAVVAFLLSLAGPGAVRAILRQRFRALEPRPADLELVGRTMALARLMGVTPGDVMVDEGREGRTYASASMGRKGRLVVSRKLLEVLTPEELDCILAHELAHLKGRHRLRQLIIWLATVALIAAPWLFVGAGPRIRAEWVRMVLLLLPMVGMAMLCFVAAWLSRRREAAADRVALVTTRNLPAMESALLKVVQHSPFPHYHDVAVNSTHPLLRKRLEALRSTAREIGLPVVEEAGVPGG